MLRWVVAICLALMPGLVMAQETPEAPRAAVLVADEVFITAERELVARGNVEAFQGLVRLQANEIRYNRTTGALVISGPIRIQDGENITVLADAADLSPDLQTGLLNGARIVVDQQLQLAAAQMQRVNDRYNQLYKTAVTSCDVCDDGRPPLWQIRAERVIHDRQEGQLYFENAQFRIRNTPIFYIPRLRLPDPTLSRATGFLIPSIRTTSELGIGLKIPYFIAIGDDRDVTITPYISSRTRTLELRYRQAFVNGEIEINTAVSRDDERPGETRGYIFAEGSFDLPKDFKLAFDLEVTSDDAYLKDYDYSQKDRLDSEIIVSRARRDEYISGGLINYKSLRDGEENATQPTIVADAIYEKRLFPKAMGGELRFAANAHTHIRTSDDDIVGRDVSRVNLEAEWLNSWTVGWGVRADATIGVAADVFNVTQDSSFDQNQTQTTPFTSVALRYPMTRSAPDGSTQFLEPVAQLSWTGASQLDLPNEESTRVEFDGGNLLSLSRFPSADRRERETVAAFGVNWAYFQPNGAETWVTIGQVIRDKADPSFSTSSGLSGRTSDYLIASQYKSQNGWEITARTLFDNSFDFTKAEVRGQFAHKRGTLAGTYLWLTRDPSEDRASGTSEISLDGSYRIDQNWKAKADWRFDVADDRAATAGIGVSYNNECVTVDLSVKRRYTTSTSLEPSTSLGFTIGLRGFSARKGTDTYAKTCG
ncbi:MAG: LPS-assembly protein LptD [Roseobacter sp.]